VTGNVDRTPWRQSLGRSASTGAKYLVLGVFTILAGYPILWLVAGSFKDQGEIYVNFWALPAQFQVDNYFRAWTQAGIGENLINSLILSVGSVMGVLILAMPAAYALVRLPIPAKAWILGGVLLTLMIQPTFIIVGLFRLFVSAGLVNTYLGLILVYVAGGLPLAIGLLTAHLQSIPKEIEESALLDGAGHVRILWSIVVPLAGPAIAVVVILTFLGAYNDLIVALTLWNGSDMQTLSIGLATLISDRRLDYPALFAGTAASLIPVVVVYLIFQRRFVSGFLSGARRP